jgi:hypothetical protein
MRIVLGDRTYNLKFRTEEIAPTLRKFPDEIASKKLSELSSKEIKSVMGRLKRNLQLMETRKGRTTASIFQVGDGGVETLITSIQVSNYSKDEYDPARGRREAWEKLKGMLSDSFSKSDLRAISTAFYDRYPKSVPNYGV